MTVSPSKLSIYLIGAIFLVLILLFAPGLPLLTPSSALAGGVSHNDCTNCHNGQASGVPEVVPIFNQTLHSQSASFPVDSGAVNETTGRCIQCHDTSSSAERLLKDYPSEPSATDTFSNNLCLRAGCHISKTSMDSESSESLHNLAADATVVPIRRGVCFGCHTPHPAASDLADKLWVRSLTEERNLFTQTVSPNYLTGYTLLCYDCHSGTSADDSPSVSGIEDIAFDASSTGYYEADGGHYIKSAIDTTTISQGDKLPCSDCHDLHDNVSNEAFIKNNLAGKDSTGLAASGNSRNGTGNGRAICNTCHGLGDGVTTPSASFNDINPLYDDTSQIVRRPISVADHNDGSPRACTECHDHNRIDHGGSSTGTGCQSCHGHTSGYTFYDPITDSTITSLGTGTTKSHATHTQNDAANVKGPNTGCSTCHDTDNFPLFADGKTLAQTDVCDTCHSPGGNYDGVDDTTIGAKSNWGTTGGQQGVYETTDTLRAGKEKWCAGCHDAAASPSTIQGVVAPPVAGDDTSGTPYGPGLGFYDTGHGLPSDQVYPWTKKSGDIQERYGAGLECDACHDYGAAHIDGESRTYAYPGTSALYQSSYRLKSVNGDYPLVVPRKYAFGDSNLVRETDFNLCFSCHNAGPFTDSANLNTNYRNGSTNSHYLHLSIEDDWGPGPVFQSDWGTVIGMGDSRATCIQCHNVHGSTGLSMVNDGTLVGKSAGLPVQYTDRAGSGWPTDLTLPDSTGTRWNPNLLSSGGLCTWECHGGSGSYDGLYLRSPFKNVTFDMVPPAISGLSPANETTGVNVNSDLAFTLSDASTGVDWPTFSIDITGTQSYSRHFDYASSEVTRTGTIESYDVTVNPDLDFTGGETITVSVNVDDIGGNPLAPTPWSFTTVPGQDFTPPTSTITTPSTGAYITSASTTVSGNSTDTGCSGVNSVEVSTDGGFSWNPASQEGGNWDNWTYDWSLYFDGNYNIISRSTDASGNVEPTGAGIFVTVDRVDPAVSDLSPSNDATGVAVTTDLTFTVSDAGSGVDTSTLSIDVSGSVGYSAHYDATSPTVSIAGSSATATVAVNPDVFSNGETITVSVNIDDKAGNPMSPPTWRFKTLEPPAATASIKQAVANDASGGGFGIQAGDQVEVKFDGPTQGNLITAANIDTALGLSSGHSWRDNLGLGGIGSAIWSTETYVYDTLTITLSTAGGSPTVNTSDTITLDGTIKDSSGTAMTGSTTITGSFGVYLPTSTITYPADGTAVNDTSLTISGSSTDTGGGGVNLVQVSTDGGFSWNAAAQVGGNWDSWTYNWDYLLSPDGTYTVMSRAINSAGNTETPSLGISIKVDRVSPSMTIISPSNDATDVSSGSNLVFTLADTSGSGVDTSTLSIDISGSVGYSKHYGATSSTVAIAGPLESLSVTVTPDAAFSANETITVTVGVDDRAGNPLSPPTWHFKTSSATPPETVIIHPSGLNSGSPYWSAIGGAWADILDSNDADSSYALHGTGGDVSSFMADMDDVSISGTLQSVQVFAYARATNGGGPTGPGPYPTPIDVDVLYQTDSLVKANTVTLPANTEEYTLVESPVYTTDSNNGLLTWSDINNLKTGIKRDMTGSHMVRVTEIYAVVTYLP